MKQHHAMWRIRESADKRAIVINTIAPKIAEFLETGRPLPPLTEKQKRYLELSKRIDDLTAIARLDPDWELENDLSHYFA